MKYTEQELRKLIEKEFKVSIFEITKVEKWLKVHTSNRDFNTTPGLKQFLKNNPFKIQVNGKS